MSFKQLLKPFAVPEGSKRKEWREWQGTGGSSKVQASVARSITCTSSEKHEMPKAAVRLGLLLGCCTGNSTLQRFTLLDHGSGQQTRFEQVSERSLIAVDKRVASPPYHQQTELLDSNSAARIWLGWGLGRGRRRSKIIHDFLRACYEPQPRGIDLYPLPQRCCHLYMCGEAEHASHAHAILQHFASWCRFHRFVSEVCQKNYSS